MKIHIHHASIKLHLEGDGAIVCPAFNVRNPLLKIRGGVRAPIFPLGDFGLKYTCMEHVGHTHSVAGPTDDTMVTY